MTKYIVYAVLLTSMAGVVALIDSRSVDYTQPDERLPVSNHIYATGVVEGATKDIQLRSEVSGRVLEVLVEVGDWVERDDVLIRLENQQQTQQVAVSHAHRELAQAKLERLINGARKHERDHSRALLTAKQARLEQAQRTWRRVQQLRVQAAVSQQESDDQLGAVETLTAEVDAARAQLEQLEAPARVDELRVAQAGVSAAQADYELARIALEKTQLRASQRGQVLDLNVEPGEIIGANNAVSAVVLADTSILRVRAYVEEIDAPLLQAGMLAQITADGLPGKIFAGRISFLSPRMSAKSISSGRPEELYDTKVREVLLDVQNAQSLLVGLRVDVSFNRDVGVSDSDSQAAQSGELPNVSDLTPPTTNETESLAPGDVVPQVD